MVQWIEPSRPYILMWINAGCLKRSQRSHALIDHAASKQPLSIWESVSDWLTCLIHGDYHANCQTLLAWDIFGIKKWYHNIHWEVDVIGKWFHWIISIGGLLGRFTAWQSLYPLVNLHSYGKIHHFQWENPLCISMVIFNSYFDITRGYQSQASVAWTIPNSRGGTLFPTCHRARADAGHRCC